MTPLLQLTFTLLVLTFAAAHIIDNNHEDKIDWCADMPCGQGNTCFNTYSGFKCFCKPGSPDENCVKEEQCILFNHTGVCRDECFSDETSFFISHLGGRFMDIRIINTDGNVTVADQVPVGDIKTQEPCLWQLSGKPNCCVNTKDVKVGCFATGSKVQLESGQLLNVEEVRTGMRVMSMDPETRLPVYADVIMLMHQEPERTEEMVKVTTSSGKLLTLTHDHLVLVVSGDDESNNYKFAEDLEVGMTLRDGLGNDMAISKIERGSRTGLFAPVTITGNIVVDGVTASCYGNHPDHYLAHTIFAPIRFLHQWAPWSYNGDAVALDGSHPYVSFLNKHLRALTGHSLVASQYRLDGMMGSLM